MNLNDLTIGEAKELFSMFGGEPSHLNHPLDGQMVVAVIPNGFIHIGKLQSSGGRYILTDASNLRYWEKRDGGLPELALSGQKAGDRVDIIGTVYIDTVLFFYSAGGWS